MDIPLKVVIHQSRSSGGYWAEVPALPGCLSQGDTIEELEANVRGAIEGWIDSGNDRPGVPDEDDEGPVAVQVL